MSLRGIFAGVLLLTGLEAVVSSQQGAQRFGGILTSIGRGVRYFLDPTVPAIPDHRSSSSSGGGGILQQLPGDVGTLLAPFDPALGWAAKLLSYQQGHAPTPTVPVVNA